MADATKNNETPKNIENMERLFLLELLVDSVEIDYPKLGLDQNTLQVLKQACVRFQFLNYPVLDICEEDFCNIPDNYQKEKIEFKSGKSCLFSLRGIPADVRSLDVCVTLVRQKEGGSCLELGKTRISLGSSFTNILMSLEGASNAGSVSRTCKDTHPLFDSKGQTVGKITVFIRLTCFGKMIITQFQISGDENKSFLFKGAPEPKMEDYDTVSDPYIRENVTPGGDASRKLISSKDCLSSPIVPQRSDQPLQGSQSLGMPPGTPGGNIQSASEFQGNSAFGMQPMSPDIGYQDMQNFSGAPPGFQGGIGAGFPGGMPGYLGGMGGFPQGGMPQYSGDMFPTPGGMAQGGMPQGGMPQGGMAQGGMPNNTYPGSLPVMPMKGAEQETAADNNFKEIGVEINGHSLTIKVPKRKKKTKVEEPQVPFCGKVAASESSSEPESETTNTPSVVPTMPDLNFCSCDVPLPPGFGVPPVPPQPKKKKKKKPKCPLELQGNYCLKPGCPMGYPMLPFPEKKSDQPQFQTPPGAIGLKGDQVIFQMPSNKQSGFETNANAQYTFGGNPESNLQKVQMMTDDQAALPSGVNPLSDVFLLKVGKKNLETGKRSMMNVEVKSPRKEEKKMVDAQTQYVMDSPAPEKGEKVAKGKKGKKGKKK